MHQERLGLGLLDANPLAEIYFYADVGNETYDIRDFVEPKPVVWG